MDSYRVLLHMVQAAIPININLCPYGCMHAAASRQIILISQISFERSLLRPALYVQRIPSPFLMRSGMPRRSQMHVTHGFGRKCIIRDVHPMGVHAVNYPPELQTL